MKTSVNMRDNHLQLTMLVHTCLDIGLSYVHNNYMCDKKQYIPSCLYIYIVFKHKHFLTLLNIKSKFKIHSFIWNVAVQCIGFSTTGQKDTTELNKNNQLISFKCMYKQLSQLICHPVEVTNYKLKNIFFWFVPFTGIVDLNMIVYVTIIVTIKVGYVVYLCIFHHA